MNTKPKLDDTDGRTLIQARRSKTVKKFRELVEHYRTRGYSDAEIVRAMAECPALVSALKLGKS